MSEPVDPSNEGMPTVPVERASKLRAMVRLILVVISVAVICYAIVGGLALIANAVDRTSDSPFNVDPPVLVWGVTAVFLLVFSVLPLYLSWRLLTRSARVRDWLLRRWA